MGGPVTLDFQKKNTDVQAWNLLKGQSLWDWNVICRIVVLHLSRFCHAKLQIYGGDSNINKNTDLGIIKDY